MFLKLHKGVFYPFVSWMRQSKQQPEEDVDTGGYLKTRRRLELSPSSPSVLSLFLRSRLHYPAGRLDRKLSCSSCAAAQLSLSGLPGQGLWASPGICPPTHIRYPGSFQDLSSRQDHHHLLSGVSSFWDHFLLWESFFFNTSSAFQNPKASVLPT